MNWNNSIVLKNNSKQLHFICTSFRHINTANNAYLDRTLINWNVGEKKEGKINFSVSCLKDGKWNKPRYLNTTEMQSFKFYNERQKEIHLSWSASSVC